jgi:hypothetical protein
MRRNTRLLERLTHGQQDRSSRQVLGLSSCGERDEAPSKARLREADMDSDGGTETRALAVAGI